MNIRFPFHLFIHFHSLFKGCQMKKYIFLITRPLWEWFSIQAFPDTSVSEFLGYWFSAPPLARDTRKKFSHQLLRYAVQLLAGIIVVLRHPCFEFAWSLLCCLGGGGCLQSLGSETIFCTWALAPNPGLTTHWSNF